jgi:exopolysaccharide biosynthesis polyprenyl glycosylphosphotransferase
MLRENQYILRQVHLILDLLLALAAFFIAHLLRQAINIYLLWWMQPATLADYYWLAPLAPVVFVAALAWNRLYASQSVRTRTREQARRIGISCLEATLVLVAIIYLVTPPDHPSPSRALILILPFVTFTLLVIKNSLLRHALIEIRRRGFNYRTVIVVGSGQPLRDLVTRISQNPVWGFRIEGLILDQPEYQGEGFEAHQAALNAPEKSLGIPILGDLSRAPTVLWGRAIDEVIFVPEMAPLAELRPLMEICEEMGVRTHLPLNFFAGRIARPVIDQFEDMAVLSYWPTRVIGPALLFKYAFDRVMASTLLLGCSPLMLAAILAIRFTSRRGEPIFFGQQRCGLNGRLFTCWKFRSMYVDAEKRRAELEALNEQSGPVFKIRHDPRVTPVGRWMRKFSIDELPQLWNVVKGDMSLVGPRPPLPAEVAQYDRWQRRRLSMKPGITCLWQVMGRNKLTFDTWMKLDLEYIDNWSLTLDFKILARTVYVVLTGYGAM